MKKFVLVVQASVVMVCMLLGSLGCGRGSNAVPAPNPASLDSPEKSDRMAAMEQIRKKHE